MKKPLRVKPSSLLHVCCASCAVYVIERLRRRYNVALYFFNPNIMPIAEYKKRLNDVQRLADEYGLTLIENKNSNRKEWRRFIKGHEKDPEGGKRCSLCFDFRLEKTEDVANMLSFEYFTTTLTLSPHKNSKVINNIGKEYKKYLGFDFSKGYEKSIELSKKHNLYRQNYCGCSFSMKK